MPATGTFFLAICFALLLTEVGARQCYTKLEYDCSSSSRICDVFPPASIKTVTECDSDVTMCSLVTVGATAQDFKMQLSAAGCLPKEDDASLTSGCYGREELEKIDPDEVKVLKLLEGIAGITLDPSEICLCDGNLCNGSNKSVFSISIITTSVVINFMLSN